MRHYGAKMSKTYKGSSLPMIKTCDAMHWAERLSLVVLSQIRAGIYGGGLRPPVRVRYVVGVL